MDAIPELSSPDYNNTKLKWSSKIQQKLSKLDRSPSDPTHLAQAKPMRRHSEDSSWYSGIRSIKSKRSSSRGYDSVCLEIPGTNSEKAVSRLNTPASSLKVKQMNKEELSPQIEDPEFDWLSYYKACKATGPSRRHSITLDSRPIFDEVSEESESSDDSFERASTSGEVVTETDRNRSLKDSKPTSNKGVSALPVRGRSVEFRWRPSLDAIVEAEALALRKEAERRLGGRAKQRLQRAKETRRSSCEL